MFAVVYVRAEIIGKLPSGQKRVHLLANGADGISFYTDNKSIVYTATAKTWLAAQKEAGTPVQIAYQLATPEVYATDPVDFDNAAGPLIVMTGGELEAAFKSADKVVESRLTLSKTRSMSRVKPSQKRLRFPILQISLLTVSALVASSDM